MKTTAAAELAWLVDDLVARIPEAQQAILLSADGLLMAASTPRLRDGGSAGGTSNAHRDDAEHMSAVAASLFGLARGAGRRFGKGKVRQAILEMENGFLFVIAAGSGACLSVLADETTDVGLMAYEMAMLVVRAGEHLGTSLRMPVVVE
jgi:predicted regulator of Ras-like GTPase activity (Roadblock/LC7/MglB family)